MKVLIIRFSSFGDIIQCLPVLDLLKGHEADWVVRKEFAPLVRSHPGVHRLWSLDRQDGLRGLWQLARELKSRRYTHIYDAHNNLRSRLLVLFLRVLGCRFDLLRRSKHRLKRYLLFRWRWHLLPTPFVGQKSFVEPLKEWGIVPQIPQAPTFHLSSTAQAPPALPERFVALVPSAAWELKRWPVQSWQKLIALNPQTQFVLLGGPEDTFCEELRAAAPDHVVNFAGKLSLAESCAVIAKASAVIANDTGLLHVADSLGRPLLALIGPTAFGYPAQPSSTTYEVDLPCKPCSKDGRGRCHNPEYQACLRRLTPEHVTSWLAKEI